MKEIIRKIGSSSHPAVKKLANGLRLGIKLPLFQLLSFRKEAGVISLIKKIQKERGFMMWPDEMVMLYNIATMMRDKEGDYAEVGVSTGGSAKLICEIKGNKPLHLFDTFEGLPEPTRDDLNLTKGQYGCSLASVQEYLSAYPGVRYYSGYFPSTAAPVADLRFSFVHLDVDLYRSTFAGIAFFYPRLVKGGILISHDYSTLPGVKLAFSEYFADKEESVIELPTSQCLVVKA